MQSSPVEFARYSITRMCAVWIQSDSCWSWKDFKHYNAVPYILLWFKIQHATFKGASNIWMAQSMHVHVERYSDQRNKGDGWIKLFLAGVSNAAQHHIPSRVRIVFAYVASACGGYAPVDSLSCRITLQYSMRDMLVLCSRVCVQACSSVVPQDVRAVESSLEHLLRALLHSKLRTGLIVACVRLRM